MRNEAHRFGISFHRDKRSAGMLRSELDEIKGIGPKTKAILLKNFASVDDIRITGHEELAKLVGTAKSTLLLEGLGKVSGKEVNN
jgi:excinuclease ABC subunit C